MSEEMAGGNEKVLSYGNVLLRRSDVSSLEGCHFLNDQIIEFYFSYLSEQFRASSGMRDAELPLLLVGPSTTFWLRHRGDPQGAGSDLDPIKLSERQMMIFAVNNNEDIEMAEGGTHWTLLMYSRQCNTFEHFDSLTGTNVKEARDLVAAIKPYMGGNASRAKFIEQATPQQENSYDCGVYVMAIAQVLSITFQENTHQGRSGDYAESVMASVTATCVSRMRHVILQLISSLATGEKKS